jgi:predicted metal-binding membrane protein
MLEPPSLRVMGIWIVGAGIAGVVVLASGRQSWWPAVIIFLLTLCVMLVALPNTPQIQRTAVMPMDKAQLDQLSFQGNVVLGLLLALVAAAWAILVWQHADATMDMMASVTLGPRVPLFLVIWVVMMVAMMLPTAAPMILTFHRVQAGNRKLGDAFGTTWVFVAAYLLGLLHGAYCLGCCWLLFVILFPLGIMNLGAMAAVTLLIFAEKTLPWLRVAPYSAAVALVLYGALVITSPQLLPTFQEDGGAAMPAEMQMKMPVK